MYICIEYLKTEDSVTYGIGSRISDEDYKDLHPEYHPYFKKYNEGDIVSDNKESFLEENFPGILPLELETEVEDSEFFIN